MSPPRAIVPLPPPAPGVLRYGVRAESAPGARFARPVVQDGRSYLAVDVPEDGAAEALDAVAVELRGGVAPAGEERAFPLTVLPGEPSRYRAAALALNTALPFLRACAEPEGSHTALRLRVAVPPSCAQGPAREAFDALLQDAVAFARRFLVPPPTGDCP
ncbi:MAG: hypothetical protein HY909_27845 [Deltaproteobacteria bacterium]|nr:hypothetical protein [Deltaproteobacteria bacterium]